VATCAFVNELASLSGRQRVAPSRASRSSSMIEAGTVFEVARPLWLPTRRARHRAAANGRASSVNLHEIRHGVAADRKRLLIVLAIAVSHSAAESAGGYFANTRSVKLPNAFEFPVTRKSRWSPCTKGR